MVVGSGREDELLLRDWLLTGREAPTRERKMKKRLMIENLVGKTVFIRTVTYGKVGVVMAANDECILLHPCMDIVRTGDFREFYRGKVAESEPVRTSADFPAYINTDSVVDITEFFGVIDEYNWGE